MRLSLALLLLAGLGGCTASFKDASRRLAKPEDPAAGLAEQVRDRRRTYYDQDATQPHTETGWVLRRDGRSLKDGLERCWYANGQLEFERGWSLDEPAGLWRTWFEDGTPRFEHEYDPSRPTPMAWWHSTGAVSSQGPARDGVREGPWCGAHPDGTPAFEGRFSAGRRDGSWTFWYPDGSIEACGRYLRGERVGTWENHAPGEHFRAAAQAPRIQ